MTVRSPLSLEKDQFNFAFSLAHDLKEHLRRFGTSYSKDIYNRIKGLQARLYDRGVATSKDIEDGICLLGLVQFQQLCLIAMMKAKLETDYVNSQYDLN